MGVLTGRVTRKLMIALVAFGLLATVAGLLSSPALAAPRLTPVQLRVASIPQDRVLMLQLTLSSLIFKGTDGSVTTLISDPTTIEFAHLGNDSEPFLVGQMFPIKYTTATMTVTGSKLTYLRNGVPAQLTSSRAFTSTFIFRPAYALPFSPTVLNLQLDLASTVAFSPANGLANVNKPVFSVNPMLVDSGAQIPETGRVDHIVGAVADSSDTWFTVTDSETGAALTFNTDANTQFINASPATLLGMTVAVHGSTAADGSLLATEVEALEASTGAVVEGESVRVLAGPQLGLVAQGGVGAGIPDGVGGSKVFVDASVASFQVDAHNVDMTGLESLQFDNSSLALGQVVRAQSASPMQAGFSDYTGAVTADGVYLEQQSLSGTVANYQAGGSPNTATFDLVLPTDGSSGLKSMNPSVSSVHMFQQSGTDLQNLSRGMVDGMPVEVRGLLFFSTYPGSGPAKTFVMVAGRITD